VTAAALAGLAALSSEEAGRRLDSGESFLEIGTLVRPAGPGP